MSMINPIILPNKKLCIDAEDIFAVWYPYLVEDENQYQLIIWLVKNGTTEHCLCLYDTFKDALDDYDFLRKDCIGPGEKRVISKISEDYTKKVDTFIVETLMKHAKYTEQYSRKKKGKKLKRI